MCGYPQVNCISLLWPQYLTIFSSIRDISHKLQLSKSTIHHVNEGCDFETTIMFVFIGQIIVLKINHGHYLFSDITIWVTINTAFYSTCHFYSCLASFCWNFTVGCVGFCSVILITNLATFLEDLLFATLTISRGLCHNYSYFQQFLLMYNQFKY
jgi:hypothetical protein